MTDKLDPARWPCWMALPDGTRAVYERPEDVPKGWITIDQLRALDHDGDGAMGGSKPSGQAKPGELTDAEINADLEAMGIEPDPTAHKSTRLKQRNAARAAR
jgi:hypothetical protein